MTSLPGYKRYLYQVYRIYNGSSAKTAPAHEVLRQLTGASALRGGRSLLFHKEVDF